MKKQTIVREWRRNYRSLVENLPKTISLHDGEKFLYINNAGVKLLQATSSQELLGSSIWKIIAPEAHPLVESAFENIIERRKKMITIRHRIIINGAYYSVEATSTLISKAERPIIQTVFHDISKRNKVEEVLQRSEKLSLVAQLAAAFSHEIGNPLTTIKGFLQMLENDKKYNEKYFFIIMNELKKIETTLYELATLSTPANQENFSNVQLNKTLTNVISKLTAKIKKKSIQIFVDLPHVPSITGDEKQLQSVFVHVIENAIEAIKNNGNISIQLKYRKKEVVVTITDNGCGIVAERMERLGEPFYSTKEKGTGLGLMISYKIIHNHRGRMEIDSEYGKGTTVQIVFPVSQKENRRKKIR